MENYVGLLNKDLVHSNTKPRIIMNLPIQKGFMGSNNKVKVVEQRVVDRIVNDPELAKILSPPTSKDEQEKEEDHEVKARAQGVEIGTQMTDREPKCECLKKAVFCASNQTNDDEAVETSNTTFYDTRRILDSVNEASFSSFKYTSPMFKACGLTSQVFKQRINLRVMKMTAFSIPKY